MALVKKLQTGGKVESDDKFDKFLEERTKDLTKNSMAVFSKEAEKLKDSYRQNKLKDAFSFQDNNYTTNIENFSGLKNGEIKKNLLGKIKLNSPEAARSYLVGLVQEFYNNNPEPIKEILAPIKLEQSIIKNRFKDDASSFGNQYSQLENTQRWKDYIVPELKNYITYYKGLKPENKHENLEELEQINTLINQENFDKNKVLELMNKSGLVSENLLLSEEDQKLWEENKAKKIEAENQAKIQRDKKTEEDRIGTFLQDLMKYGLPESTVTALGQAGYLNYDTGFKSTQPWLNEYLKNNPDLKVLVNNAGKHIIINKQGIFNKTFQDVNNPSLFGKVITSDIANGIYTETAEQAQKAGRGKFGFGQEQLRGSEIENGLPKSMIFKINNPEFAGALEVQGSPETPTGEVNVRDAFGNLDYYRHLQVTMPGNKIIHLYRNSDGTYSYPNSGQKLNLNIQDTNLFRKYTYTKPFDYKANKLVKPINITNDYVNILMDKLKKNEVITTIEKSSLINWAKKNPTNSISEQIYKYFPSYRKNGGKINKLYVGGFVQREAVKAKKPIEKDKEEEVVVKEPVISKGTRLNDTSLKGIMDKIALAGNTAMFVPGVTGLAGGAVSTIAEAISDFSDGVDLKDFGNLLLNTGLTAAAFFGAGGLKGAVKAAQLTNKATKLAKEAKEAKEVLNLEKATKLTKKSEELTDKATKITESLDKKQLRNISPKYQSTSELMDVAKKTGNSSIITKLKELEAKGIKNITKSEDSKEILDFAERISVNNDLFRKAIKTITPSENVTKWTGNIATVYNTAASLKGLGELKTKIEEGNIGSFNDITTDDISNAMGFGFGLTQGARYAKKFIGKRFGTEIKSNEVTKVVGKIKNKEIELIGPEAESFVKSSKNQKKVKQMLVDKYNAENEVKAELKDLIGIQKVKPSGGLSVKTGYLDPNKNIKLQEIARKWAEKYYPSQIKSEVVNSKVTEILPKIKRFKPGSLNQINKKQIEKYNPNHKQGGVLKFQNPAGSIPSVKQINDVLSGNILPNKLPTLAEIKAKNYKPFVPKLINPPIPSTGNIAKPKDNNLLSGFLTNLDKNKEFLMDTGMYLLANKLNEKNVNLQKEALTKSFMPYLNVPRITLNKANPILTDFENAAVNYQDVGNRIAGSTSDINKGIAAQLESTKRANETRLQGQLKSADYLQNLKLKQADLDAARDERNTQLNYSTLAANKDIAKNIYLTDVNKNLQSYMNLSNYRDAIQQFTQKRKYENMFDQLTNVPDEMKGDMTRYNKIANKDYSNEKEYQAWQKLLPEEKVNKTFETSDYYTRMMKELDPITKRIQDYQNNRDIIQARLARGMVYAKGGSLSVDDRIRIEQEKGSQKRSVESLRQYYKRLMKNEEFLQKAMIKIFK